MRPVNRGPNPQATDFDNYREAFPVLVSRLGYYCSYCERRIPTNLAVEHIQPKGLPQYANLEGRWDNFLLGCVNCNGTKTDKDVDLSDYLLPDRDNTAHAYTYTPDGKVASAAQNNAAIAQMATATLELCGLDKGPNQVVDENGKIVAIDRIAQRIEVWMVALMSKEDLASTPTDGMRRQILLTALGYGFFSIWMQVFSDDAVMRRLLLDGFPVNGHIVGFPGTATDCFDAACRTVSPRPNNGLQSAGKI